MSGQKRVFLVTECSFQKVDTTPQAFRVCIIGMKRFSPGGRSDCGPGLRFHEGRWIVFCSFLCLRDWRRKVTSMGEGFD